MNRLGSLFGVPALVPGTAALVRANPTDLPHMRRKTSYAIWRLSVITAVGLICFGPGCLAHADGILPFDTIEINKYLLIGTTDDPTADAVDVDNGELGSHKAGAPFDPTFTTPDGTFPGQLIINVPDIPLGALPVFGGINHSGNIAVTHSQGNFNFNDVAVYADTGVQAADSAGNADHSNSGSNYYYYDTTFTDDPNDPDDGSGGFTNTLDSFGLANPGVNNNTFATGKSVKAQDVPATYNLVDGNGLTGEVNFEALKADLGVARTAIAKFDKDDDNYNEDGNGNPINFATIDLTKSSSIIGKSMHPNDKGFDVSGDITATADSEDAGGSFTVTLQNTGLTVIDFDLKEGASKLEVSNYNFVIDGPEGSFAVLRVPNGVEFATTQANVLAGTGGIGYHGIIIATLNTETNNRFTFSQSILNGVAFWSLPVDNGKIDHSNTQGCAQFISGIVDMDNVRYVHCTAGPIIPAPSTVVGLASMGMVAAVAWLLRRRRSAASRVA